MTEKLWSRERVEEYRDYSWGKSRTLAETCLYYMNKYEKSKKESWKCHEESMKAQEEIAMLRAELEAK
jgi:hypothetical protein